MKSKPKILEYYDKVDSACSFWRGRGTNSELSKQDLIEIKESNWNLNWPDIRMFDIAFFQRPIHKKCIDQVFLCKDLGLKIWIDLDDWKDCPKDHVMYDEYQKSFDELSFKKILHCADVITLTNERMFKYYSYFYPNLVDKFKIIPNAINDYVYSFKELSGNKQIVYRGGSNHEYDIMEYHDVIKKVLINNPDWHFISIGYDIKILKGLSNYQYIDNFDIHSYLGLICNINPSIFIVPLQDNDFNRCKSNISWIEGTLSGAACLCPNYFEDTISLHYNSKHEFGNKLQILIDNDGIRNTYRYNSVLKIKEKYLLSNVNKQRIELINSLL
jgi:glycosyltransferase involved in cell wall biosynthesis